MRKESVSAPVAQLDRASAFYAGTQSEISTLPFGTQVDPDLLRVPLIAHAINAALPAHSGLQRTLGGWYEVVNLKVSR